MAFQAEKAQAVPEKATDTTHLRQMEVSSGSRLLFIDNLRILLICLVVVQHLSVTYGATGFWYYRNPATDPFTRTFLTIYDGIPQASGMGIFFLIAGYFTPGSFDRKGMARFLRDRLMRLGTPWLLYELLLDPLLFSVLYAAWRWLSRHRAQVAERSEKLPTYRTIWGFIIALGLASFMVRIWWPVSWILQPINLDMGYLPQYLGFYLLGLLAFRRDWFIKVTPRMGTDWSRVAMVASLFFAGMVLPFLLGATGRAGTQLGTSMAGGLPWLAFGYALWETFIVVAVCLGFLVLFRTRWNRQGRVAKNLATNAYTVYFIHPLVLVVFCYVIHTVALYPLLKFAIAVIITLPLCFLLSGFIRKIPLAGKIL